MSNFTCAEPKGNKQEQQILLINTGLNVRCLTFDVGLRRGKMK